MKRRKIRYADRRTVQACIDQLQAIIDGLKAGSIGIQHEADSVLLRPGGDVELELRVEQLERKETLRVELSWRPEPESAPEHVPQNGATLQAAAVLGESAVTNGASAPPGDAPGPVSGPVSTRGPVSSPVSTRAPDRMLSDHERLFSAFHRLGGDGRWHIDQDGLIQSLARAGVDPLIQQELYALAMQADADGRAAPLSERVIDALEQAGRRQPPSSHS
jgi:amphi-Trp domain-containing protein